MGLCLAGDQGGNEAVEHWQRSPLSSELPHPVSQTWQAARVTPGSFLYAALAEVTMPRRLKEDQVTSHGLTSGGVDDDLVGTRADRDLA